MDARTGNYMGSQTLAVHPGFADNTLAEQVLILAGEAAQIEIAVGLVHTRIEKLDRRLPIDIAEAGYALRDTACDLRELLLLWLGAAQ